ncbi:MAG: dCMP deaminase family protein [Patescibacteria group bacterium]|jgi:dCMP deaminase
MNGKTKAREDFLSWDDTFMLMADLIAKRSKDPSTQTGSVIVDQNNVVLGLGYNGFPRGTKEGDFPWDREGGYEKDEFLKTKYPYVVHAEVNAIFNSNNKIEGAKMYCHLFPCNECAKAIIQNGVKELIYQEDKYNDVDIFQASRKLFDAAGIKVRQYIPTKKLEIK